MTEGKGIVDVHQDRAIIGVSLDEIWREAPRVFLAYCKCGRLNMKAKVLGYFDDFAITCPNADCKRVNKLADLRFTN